jgi:hypothetical protein
VVFRRQQYLIVCDLEVILHLLVLVEALVPQILSQLMEINLNWLTCDMPEHRLHQT